MGGYIVVVHEWNTVYHTVMMMSNVDDGGGGGDDSAWISNAKSGRNGN